MLLHPLLCTLETLIYPRSVSVSQPSHQRNCIIFVCFSAVENSQKEGNRVSVCDECHIFLVIALFVPVNSLDYGQIVIVTILDDFLLRVAFNILSKLTRLKIVIKIDDLMID